MRCTLWTVPKPNNKIGPPTPSGFTGEGRFLALTRGRSRRRLWVKSRRRRCRQTRTRWTLEIRVATFSFSSYDREHGLRPNFSHGKWSRSWRGDNHQFQKFPPFGEVGTLTRSVCMEIGFPQPVLRNTVTTVFLSKSHLISLP
jgi:hypothetical protein